MDITFNIEDNSGVILRHLGERVHKSMYAAALTSQKHIVDYMSKPDFTGNDIVDTGRLRASISFIAKDKQGKGMHISKNSQPMDTITGLTAANEAIIGSNVEYAAYVNNGTTKQPPRRFMEHGILDNKTDIQAIITDVIKGVR